MILQTSSGSIRNVASLSNVTRPGVVPIFASTVRPILAPGGTVMMKYGTYDPFVLGRVLINAGIGRTSAREANRTRRDSGNDVNDPKLTAAGLCATAHGS
jgi:hypothetical protein